MTREEAIDLLDNLIGMVNDNHDSDYDTALKMAINSLKQEPIYYPPCQDCHTKVNEIVRAYNNMKSCDDCVSRQAVNDLYDRYHPRLATRVYEFGEELKTLPSVTPKREQGEWIGVNPMVDTLMCSKCGENIISEEFKSNYCPNCGAKMR